MKISMNVTATLTTVTVTPLALTPLDPSPAHVKVDLLGQEKKDFVQIMTSATAREMATTVTSTQLATTPQADTTAFAIVGMRDLEKTAQT